MLRLAPRSYFNGKAPPGAALALRPAALGQGVGDFFGLAATKTRAVRLAMFGTSISAGSLSTWQKFEEDVRAKWGDAGTFQLNFGGIGGSFTNTYQGWSRQPYGGPSFVRLRGESTSTPIRLIVYGDQIDIFYSQETNAAAFEVTVDGISAGTFGAPGAQAYSQLARISADLGPHEVTITPPASGYCYLERIAARNTEAIGVDVLDFTYGGSSLNNAITLQTATGSQVSGIAISGDSGVNSLFGVPNLDGAIVSFTVNDAGKAGTWASTNYAIELGKLLDGFRAASVPVLLVVEMAGHYAMPNDGGSSALNTAFEQVKAAILAEHGDGVHVLNWDSANRQADIAAYAAAYYPTVASLNVAAGTFTGDFIHPSADGYTSLDGLATQKTGVPIKVGSSSILQTAARWRSFPTILRGEREVTVDGSPKNLEAVASAVQALTYDPSLSSRLLPVFVDPTATNTANAATQRANIAASGSSDGFGKYVTLTNLNLGSFTLNQDYWLTLKMGGAASARSSSATLRIYIDGEAMPYTDVANSRTVISWTAGTAGTDEPILIALRVKATANSQFVTLNGRLYDIAATLSDYPVLPA